MRRRRSLRIRRGLRSDRVCQGCSGGRGGHFRRQRAHIVVSGFTIVHAVVSWRRRAASLILVLVLIVIVIIIIVIIVIIVIICSVLSFGKRVPDIGGSRGPPKAVNS